MRSWRRKVSWIVLIPGLYILGYFVLMVRDVPAWKNGKIAFRSSFRWASVCERTPGVIEISISDSAVSIWNYIFLPADSVFYPLSHEAGIDSKLGNYLQRH